MTTCPLCNKEFKQLHGSHIQTHGLTTAEFKQRFPDVWLGNQGSYQAGQEAKRQRLAKETPKYCLHCNTQLVGTYRKINRFCNSSCAASYNNVHGAPRIYSRVCQQCNKTFTSNKIYITRSKYCSHECSNLAKLKDRVKVQCNHCGKDKHVPEITAAKRQYFFCNVECRETFFAQTKHNRGIHKPHNGLSSPSTYRKRAFANYKHECARCGYNKHKEVLQVHHKDKDRTNNDLSNLIILCPTCHSETHKVPHLASLTPKGNPIQ